MKIRYGFVTNSSSSSFILKSTSEKVFNRETVMELFHKAVDDLYHNFVKIESYINSRKIHNLPTNFSLKEVKLKWDADTSVEIYYNHRAEPIEEDLEYFKLAKEYDLLATPKYLFTRSYNEKLNPIIFDLKEPLAEQVDEGTMWAITELVEWWTYEEVPAGIFESPNEVRGFDEVSIEESYDTEERISPKDVERLHVLGDCILYFGEGSKPAYRVEKLLEKYAVKSCLHMG